MLPFTIAITTNLSTVYMIESVSLREMQRLHEFAKYEKANEMDYVFVHVGTSSRCTRMCCRQAEQL